MYEAVIGLEVHVELKTKSKIFCGCSTEFGAKANTQVCPVCLGMPGVLPVLNKKVVEYAILAGLSLNCQIAEFSKLDRKNYFYPDLPKAYQISQYDLPLCKNGYLEIEAGHILKRIGITRIHIEEDASKLTHEGDTISQAEASLVDFNRGGVPLIEIVSEPDLSSPQEAVEYLANLKAILQYIDISDCKMEEGSLRCDGNISIRPVGAKEFGIRTEIKNINSFKALQKALEYEIERQKSILQSGEKVIQETRTWDESRGITLPLRSKEEAHDYRYFPEPDLVPIKVDSKWLNSIKAALPELPQAKKVRFVEDFGLPVYDAEVLTKDKELAQYFEEALPSYNDPKKLSNWIMAEFLRLLNAEQISVSESLVKPKEMAELLNLVEEGIISGKIAKEVFEDMFKTGEKPQQIILERNLGQISDEGKLREIVKEVVRNNSKSVEDFRSGKEKAFGFLVGQIMKETKGQANPQLVNSILKEFLKQK
nr:Asp-tRNA(Asn)/Glu-tRNA(Gln) amidotransferase subunit GatB [Desulfitibacter alkalitolerans]